MSKFFSNIAKYGGFGLIGRRAWEKGDANKELETLLSQDPTYTRSKYPGMQLGLAQQTLNSRMPGSSQFQNNLFSSQANTLANINRNATDSSQALSLGAAAQGQTDQALGDLQLQEAEWKKFGLQNLNQAYGANQEEDQVVFGDSTRRFGNKAQIRGAQSANKQATSKELLNLVMAGLNLGMSGGFGKK